MARDPHPTAIFGLLVALSAAVGGGSEVHAQNGRADGALSIDQLLSIESVVGGAPSWSPDGSAILFESGLTGGLATLSPEGGFPTRVPVDMGGSGHFLTSQMPGWSPSGTWISYVSDKSGAPEIWIWSTRDGSDVQLTDLGARINSMSWSPDERSIVFAGDRYGNYDIWKVDVATRQVDRLTEDKRYEVFPTWTPDSRHILYVRLDDAWEDHDVIEVDAAGANPRTVIEDRDFFDYGAGATFGYPSVSPEGSSILFRSHRSGWINYWLAPRDGGEPRPVAPADADQSAAVWSPDGRWIAYTENHNGHHDLRVVSANGGEPRVLVSPKGGVASSPSWSPDGRAIAYLQENLTRPRDLYVVSLEDGSSRGLTSSMPAGNFGGRLVMPEKMRYESTDGYSIPAYLYRPPGAAAGDGLPGVMWIHGGPTSQFHDTFQQHVQFFVQRGYVVFLPNIRGSSGYGKDFADANNGCWGHCDLEDVVAGADYLRALPEVDPERIEDHGDELRRRDEHVRRGLRAGRLPGGDPGVGIHGLGPLLPRRERTPAHQAARPRTRAVRDERGRVEPQFLDLARRRRLDADPPRARRGSLSGLRPVGDLRAGAGELLQAVPVQDVPERELLRLREGEPPADAPRHARLLRAVPEVKVDPARHESAYGNSHPRGM